MKSNSGFFETCIAICTQPHLTMLFIFFSVSFHRFYSPPPPTLLLHYMFTLIVAATLSLTCRQPEPGGQYWTAAS